MIAFVEGPIVHMDPTHVIINVSGIGYEIKISLNTYADIKGLTKGKLFTHFHVKEDAQVLLKNQKRSVSSILCLYQVLAHLPPS
jgi:Holliday junction DNA helicase RuvA